MQDGIKISPVKHVLMFNCILFLLRKTNNPYHIKYIVYRKIYNLWKSMTLDESVTLFEKNRFWKWHFNKLLDVKIMEIDNGISSPPPHPTQPPPLPHPGHFTYSRLATSSFSSCQVEPVTGSG